MDKTKDLQEQVNRLRDGDNTLYYENSTRKGENTQLEKRVFRLEIIISILLSYILLTLLN